MSLRGAIGRARKRVEKRGDYIASMEIRTRYTLIDPILQALGWNLDDPSLVQIEYPTTLGANPSRIEYALLSNEEPVVLVEAKKLSKEYLPTHKGNMEQARAMMKEAWTKLRRGEEIPNAPPIIFWWRDLMADHEDQLKRYVDQLQLRSGYAVLTDGAYWHIADLAEETENFTGKHLAAVNILFDAPSRCEEVLGVLRRGRWK